MDARRLLKNVSDRRATAVLLRAVRDFSGTAVEQLASNALANSGDPLALEQMTGHPIRASTVGTLIRYLVNCEDPDAREVLVDMLGGEWWWAAALGLGLKGDRRATTHLLRAVEEQQRLPWTTPTKVLVELNDPDSVAPLIGMLEQALDVERFEATILANLREISARREADKSPEAEERRAFSALIETAIRARVESGDHPHGSESLLDPDEQQRKLAAATAQRRLVELLETLDSISTPEAQAAVDSALELVDVRIRTRPPPPSYERVVPTPEERTVPSWTLELRRSKEAGPGTRFGGQPTWLSSPTWPLTPEGIPMSFWAQFRLPWDQQRMAYLFIDINSDLAISENGGAALFVQPDATPETDWIDSPTGPLIPTPSYSEGLGWSFDDPNRQALEPALNERGNPPEWWRGETMLSTEDDRDVNKIGGTPLWLQGDETPQGDGWRFLFQFLADYVGNELGDVAECYGFVHDPTGKGMFVWQCH